LKNAKPAKGQALEGVLNVNNICKQLVARMIVNTMAGRQAQTKKLYEEYFRERYLHVPVSEILRSKRKEGIA
jgi:hypothetical protein